MCYGPSAYELELAVLEAALLFELYLIECELRRLAAIDEHLRALENSREYYIEYVRDHNHELVFQIPEVVALDLIAASPYYPLSTWYQTGTDGTTPPTRLMNKGAFRITPGPGLDNYKIRAVLGQKWWPSSSFSLRVDRDREMWVYNHDGRYWLTRPRQS